MKFITLPKGVSLGNRAPAPKQNAKQQAQQNAIKLNQLRANVMAQTAYTPQARAYLSKLPMNVFQQAVNGPLGMYNQGRGVGVGNQVLNNRKLAPEVLRHEMVHAMDKGINLPRPVSMPGVGATSGDSYMFTQKMPNNSILNAFLNRYQNKPQVRDTEGYAQFGAQGQNVLLNKQVGSAYSNIYRPMTPAIRYSPIYPVR